MIGPISVLESTYDFNTYNRIENQKVISYKESIALLRNRFDLMALGVLQLIVNI